MKMDKKTFTLAVCVCIAISMLFPIVVSAQKPPTTRIGTNPPPPPPPPPHFIFKTKPDSLNFESEGITKEVIVKANNPWKIIGYSEWINPIIKGYKLFISVDPNPNEENRKGWVQIQSKKKTIVINVSQKGKPVEDFIKTSPSNISVSSSGYRQFIYVTSSKEWEIQTKPSDWVILSRGENNTLVLNFKENFSTSPRSCYLILKCGKMTSKVDIQQEGKPCAKLDVYPSSVYSSASGGKYKINVSASDYWDIRADTPSWITIEKNSYKGLTITLMRNPYKVSRSFSFTINCDGLTKTVSVYQYGI